VFFKRLVTAFQMLSVVVAAFTLALLFVKEPPSVSSTSTAAPGAGTFAANCASCHGATGDGGSAPRLAGVVADRYPNIDDQLAVVRDGKGLMPAFGSRLGGDELRQVVEFTRTPMAAAGTGPGGAIDAKAIYTAKCAGCHDADGSGTYLNGVSFVGGAMKTKYPNVDEQISVVVHGRGDMKPFEGTLSPEEIKAVVEYTRSQL